MILYDDIRNDLTRKRGIVCIPCPAQRHTEATGRGVFVTDAVGSDGGL
jgi:hypothetical protein